MAFIHQQVCDGCGQVLFGKNGTQSIKKDYITIKGRVTVHEVDKVSGYVAHLHATPTEDEDLSFCKEMDGVKLDCLQAYIDSRLQYVRQKMENNKRNRATQENSDEAQFGARRPYRPAGQYRPYRRP